MAKAVLVVLLAALAAAQASHVSPVQKVIELLDSCKAKVQSDIDAEAKAMEEYSAFCDTELEEKGLAIKTAVRTISELDADVEDSEAVISTAEEEIGAVSEIIAEKEGEMASAAAERATEQEGFVASEKEMLESVEEITGAVAAIKQAPASLLQAGKKGTNLRGAVSALAEIVKAGRLGFASHKRLHSLLQAAQAAKEDSEDFMAEAPSAAAFESQTGGITDTLEDMQKKAEDGVRELRKQESESAHSFEMAKQNLETEMKNSQERLAQVTKTKAEATEKLGLDQSELVETKKTKAADEAYSRTLKMEYEETKRGWADRQKSTAAEMSAIDKAKEILASGVKAFMQVAARTQTRLARWGKDTDAETREGTIRAKLGSYLKKLARKQRSYALAQLASVSAADPFVKIRGLIEGMVSKLMAEAQEEATKEAFCQQEIGKSKASKETKEDLIEKHSSQLEEAETRTSELTGLIKTLEAEIAEIDKSQVEATQVREQEKADYGTASKDYRDSADAVSRAIAVLREYYEGVSLAQVSQHSRRASAPPTFGGAKGDAGGSIISILEMSAEDFTTLLAETEEAEEAAVAVYEELSKENEVARSAKDAEAKAAASEVNSVKVALENAKEDKVSAIAELNAVLAYIEKLKPDCESKAMSYAERKAARAAEVQGLKEALGIMEGRSI